MSNKNLNEAYLRYIDSLYIIIKKSHETYGLDNLRKKYRDIDSNGYKQLKGILYDILKLKLESHTKILSDMKNILYKSLDDICNEIRDNNNEKIYDNICLNNKKYDIKIINIYNLEYFINEMKIKNKSMLRYLGKVLERYKDKNATFVDKKNNFIYILINPYTDISLDNFIIESIYEYDNNIDDIKVQLEK